VSRPFDRPQTGKIAVKVINDYGDEVMKVFPYGREASSRAIAVASSRAARMRTDLRPVLSHGGRVGVAGVSQPDGLGTPTGQGRRRRRHVSAFAVSGPGLRRGIAMTPVTALPSRGCSAGRCCAAIADRGSAGRRLSPATLPVRTGG
jgi:hypothetical protein